MTAWRSYIRSKLAAAKVFVLQKSDPALLLFLLTITNYRFSLKILALVAIYIYRPDFKFRKCGVIYFYAGIIVLSLFHLLVVSGDLSYDHSMVVLGGCLLWLACGLAFHQLMLSVEANPVTRTANTLRLLTLINLAASLFDLAKIMLATHALNPYNQISPPPYGISSGDLIGGVFGEMHLVNMSISFMLLLFFLYQRDLTFSLLCLLPFLLTGSNFGSLLLLAALALIFVVKNDKLMRYYVLFYAALVFIFYVKVTPDNFNYLYLSLTKLKAQTEARKPKQAPQKKQLVKNPDGLPWIGQPKSAEELKNEKIWKYIQYKYGRQTTVNNDSLFRLKEKFYDTQKKRKVDRTIYAFHVKDSLATAKNSDKRFEYGHLKKFDFAKRSGKLISFEQTKDYLLGDWRHFLFGAGLGSFSSRLAYITSGIVDDSRILMALPRYEHPAFTNNHKAIFKYLLYLDDAYHSVTNLPFSWYNELLGEYGLIGLLLFIFCYLGFFLKRFRLLHLGKLILALMLVLFLFDYWYQRLSVMLIFELILLLDLKINAVKQAPAERHEA